MKTYTGIVCTLLLCTACKKSYPGLYAEIIDPDNPNPEITVDTIPIQISLTVPSFALVTDTRGTGPFGFWNDEEERQKWLNAEFGVYAFLTPNHQFTETADLSAGEIPDGSGIPYCLIDDRKAHISPACELMWDDIEPPCYSVAYPEYKFNFFLYHIGEPEALLGTDKYRDRVIKHIRIDGTQDVISAYARPNMDNVASLGDNEESKYLMNHAGDLIYSTKSGRLHIDPHFRVRHELSRLNFKVKAAEDLEQGCSVGIEAVGIIVPTWLDFTVAADWNGISADWNDETLPPTGLTWNNNVVGDTIYVPTSTTPTTFGATFNRSETTFKPNIMVHDKNEEAKAFGRPLLVPPVNKISMIIYYRYYTPEGHFIPNGSLFVMRYNEVKIDGNGFQANQQHEVLLQVHGPQSIKVEIDGKGLAWDSGGDIEVE